MLAARTEPTVATPSDGPSWRVAAVVMFSGDRAALLWVGAAPAMTSGNRGPRLATVRPASGAHRAMTTGIGKMDRPACRADRPRTSCRYKVDRNRNPAIAAIAQTALRLAPANGTLRKNRKSIMGSARRGS